MPDLFKDWVKSVNDKSRNLFHERSADEESLSEDYNCFMMNKAFSQYHDSIAQANMMNVRSEYLTPKMKYDFLYHTIDKSSRFSKWAKSDKDEDVALVRRAFGYNRVQSENALELLSDEVMNEIRELFNEGGRNGK